ncbi:hypothetical protein A4X09_0g3025 [Tilletia walkeri]|uniref:Uncharacterized protein n=1 Tax=Tilletia walkeri TaxID=117179 RepID=A0A8X7T5Z7_9BASI|nr:hypothetical protein A4X09_0g3025 [Tilletia walkeri]
MTEECQLISIGTHRFARKKDVDAANEAKLRKLEGDTTDYLAHDSFSNFEEFEFNRYLDSTNAPKKLTLKKNSQVVFLKGDSARGEFIKPGTHGVTTGLADATKWEKVQAVAKELEPRAYTVTVRVHVAEV